MTQIIARLTSRGDTEANWTSNNPVLSAKEIAFSTDAFYTGTDQQKFKVGDGIQTWTQLDYMPIGSSTPIWGDITGTLSNQTDLQSALDDKPDNLNEVLINGNTSALSITTGSNTTNGDMDVTGNYISAPSIYGDYTSGITYAGSGFLIKKIQAFNGDSTIVTGQRVIMACNDQNELRHDVKNYLNAPINEVSQDPTTALGIVTKQYADGLVAGLLDDRGSYDASSNLFPSSGGSGTAGAILKGDIWYISVAGTLGGSAVTVGDSVRALVDTPGQTSTNWSILETNIGYVPENVANKTNTVSGNEASTSLYLSVKGYYDYLVGLVWMTAQLFGTWINGLTSKTTPVDADQVVLMDSADSNKSKKISWANIKATLASTFFLDATSSIQTQLDNKKFTIQFETGALSPLDGTTYYFSDVRITPNTTATNFSFNLGYAYTVIGVKIGVGLNSVSGSNETSTLQLRNITQGTSTSIGAFATDGSATIIRSTTFPGLNISVAAGDSVALQIDTATWTTNPVGIVIFATLVCKAI